MDPRNGRHAAPAPAADQRALHDRPASTFPGWRHDSRNPSTRFAGPMPQKGRQGSSREHSRVHSVDEPRNWASSKRPLTLGHYLDSLLGVTQRT